MELRVLRYFLALAREESIGKASEALNITQPTLSRQLSDLEKTVGKKLFHRGSRKISLTEDGILLRKRAQEIVSLADKTVEELTLSDEIIRGEVSIGAGEMDAFRLVARTAKRVNENHPHIHFHFYSGIADDVIERLDMDLLGFAFVFGAANVRKYGFLRLSAPAVCGLLMRKDSKLAKLTTIKPEDLRNLPLMCSKRMFIRNILSSWMGDDMEKLNIIASFNLIYNAALLVEEGFGYALCIDKLVHTDDDSNLCFRPVEPRVEMHPYFVWKKDRPFSKAEYIFFEYLKTEISNFNNS